jgi:alkylation response protein AidB-like acyl-CoA dehydrogenase
MDVRLSTEQEALRDSAAAMMDRLGPHTVRDLDDDERAEKLDAAVDSAGWRELRSPADGGQPVASAVEAAIIAEELGRGLADTPFLGPTLAADLRRRAGAMPATGPESVVLMSDLSGPFDLSGPAEVPALDAVVVDSHHAASALVLARAAAGWTLAEVAVGSPARAVDLTRSVAVADDMAANRLAGPMLSDDDVHAWTSLGLALACADLVGVMRGVIEQASEYATSRRQYGVPIGSFQAVQHLLADAFVAMEGSRSVARHAAWAVDARPPADALLAASIAKAYCARAARTVCEMGIQVHGGIGNTWDCLAHVFLRRALLSIDVFGGAGASLGRILDHHGIGDRDGLR